MADLSVESDSLLNAASHLRMLPDTLPMALAAFKTRRHDLSAFGVLGSLTNAASQVRTAMDDLADAADALSAEWDTQAGILQDIGQAFADLDAALAGQTPDVPLRGAGHKAV